MPSELIAAMSVARRSNLKRFYTGAALFDAAGELVSRGWSHTTEVRFANYRSMHAEHHAMRRAPFSVERGVAAVATLSARGNWTYSMPCEECAALLDRAGILKVYFTTPNGWDVIYL
jgi:tRNA(Arg) A34 adenosine deaminase TadA